MSPRTRTPDELVVARALAARAHAGHLVEAIEDAFAHAAQSGLGAALPERVRRAPHGETLIVVGVALARHYRYDAPDSARRLIARVLELIHPDGGLGLARELVDLVRNERDTCLELDHREDGGDLPDEQPPTTPDAPDARRRSGRPDPVLEARRGR